MDIGRRTKAERPVVSDPIKREIKQAKTGNAFIWGRPVYDLALLYCIFSIQLYSAE